MDDRLTDHGHMNGFDLIRFPPSSGNRVVSVRQSGADSTVLVVGEAIRLGRSHVPNARDGKLYRPHIRTWIAGGAMIDRSKSLIDFPTQQPWGMRRAGWHVDDVDYRQ